ncbi:MAG: hypothetical protein U5O15_00005, partial [Candidatus Krumholzibacteriota bacterium]|nr:hypothetical protein [Candidatus Krumholzibacteriota bacterium]
VSARLCGLRSGNSDADKVSKVFACRGSSHIRPRKGEYYLLDRMTKACPNKVIFPVPNAVSKGMLELFPPSRETALVGPTAEEVRE